jgi:hypothetical protein
VPAALQARHDRGGVPMRRASSACEIPSWARRMITMRASCSKPSSRSSSARYAGLSRPSRASSMPASSTLCDGGAPVDDMSLLPVGSRCRDDSRFCLRSRPWLHTYSRRAGLRAA